MCAAGAMLCMQKSLLLATSVLHSAVVGRSNAPCDFLFRFTDGQTAAAAAPVFALLITFLIILLFILHQFVVIVVFLWIINLFSSAKLLILIWAHLFISRPSFYSRLLFYFCRIIQHVPINVTRRRQLHFRLVTTGEDCMVTWKQRLYQWNQSLMLISINRNWKNL